MKKIDFLQQENYAPEANNLDPIYTTDQLMKVLSICRRTAQNLRDSGKLTFYKVGGKILYRMSDVNKMLNNHKIQSF
jgi:excisionase family DNA binding protein